MADVVRHSIRQRLRRRMRVMTRGRALSTRTRRGGRRIFVENHRAAMRRVRGAEAALRSNQAAEAEALAMQALLVSPGCTAAFQPLARALSQQGQEALAGACHRGELSDAVLQRQLRLRRWLEGPPESAVRIALGGGERVQATLPPDLPASISAAFPRTGGTSPSADGQPLSVEIVAAERYVDRVADGRVWQDAHNTVVFDRGGFVQADQTTGNASLVTQIAATHEPVSLGRRAIVLGARGSGNYYHWLTDVLPKLELCRQAGIDLHADDRVVLPFRRASFQLETLAAYGIDEAQVHYATRHSPYVRADELIVPKLGNAMGTRMGAWLPEALAERLLGTRGRASGTRRLFVSRDPRRSQGRELGNLLEVSEWFVTQGFEVVYPETLSVREQATLFASAAVVAGPHGAGLANIVFCSPGTRVVEFYGAHLAPCYWAISALAKFEYQALSLCRLESDRKNGRHGA